MTVSLHIILDGAAPSDGIGLLIKRDRTFGGLITSISPHTWQQLQAEVGTILSECGLQIRVESEIPLARGVVEIDVYAEEIVAGRSNVILCECKHWQRPVPRSVIHSFRSVVTDAGANVGYIVSSAGFQSGAHSASAFTNLRLCDWPEFQEEFSPTWIQRHLIPTVRERFAVLRELYYRTVVPGGRSGFLPDEWEAFYAIVKRWSSFVSVIDGLSPVLEGWGVQRLPLGSYWSDSYGTPLPTGLLDATGYRDVLDVALGYQDVLLKQVEPLLSRRRHRLEALRRRAGL